MDKAYAIEIKQMTKTYGKNRGVSALSLKVEEGDIFGFLGPNGAGKSTTIRSLLGMIHFQTGSASILGMDVRLEQQKVLQAVGYMPSEAMFYPSMKVSEVIRFASEVRHLDCREEATVLCERLQVPMDKRIEELSLGNRKKVSIVCALQHKPRLLILDEPTSGLDPLMQNEFFKIILEYNRAGITCFLSSHVLQEIRQYCHHAAIIKEGKLIRADSVANLTRTHAKRIHVIKDGKEERFVYNGNLNELLADFTKYNITELSIEEPSLEEIFMHYYQNEED